MSEISKTLETKIRQQAKNRCGYCLLPQKLISYKLELEHIYPKSLGGENIEENLWLACRRCNLIKGVKTYGFDVVTFQNVKLFNPRNQNWNEHFAWNDTKIIAKTACGRATIDALELNSEIHLKPRAFWKLTGIFPPED